MPEPHRLNLGLAPDDGEALERITSETGQSRSVVVGAAVRTLDHIRQHRRGRALVLTDAPRPGDTIVVPGL